MGRLNMDMFPHTNEMAKWWSISFRIPRGVLDVLPIHSCQPVFVNKSTLCCSTH